MKFLSITNYLPHDLKMALRHPAQFIKILMENNFTALSRCFLGSLSQHGEDIIIYNLLKKPSKGVYVDVGANDPEIISNTMFFYKKGWRGINIEPHPEVFKKLCAVRSEDINVNMGISSQEGELTFYKLDKTEETAGSTFDKSIAESLVQKGYTLAAEIKMAVKPLSMVLEQNLNNRKIDFMSVDTEGFDLEVLKSNNWELYRPNVVIVETTINKDKIYEFMNSVNYKIVYSNSANTIFQDSNTGR